MSTSESTPRDLPRGRLLIVDDEAKHMTALCRTLQEHGYETTGFDNGQAALEALRHQAFDLLLTDIQMPLMDGLTLLQEALSVDPHLIVILMTGHATVETAVQAMKLGAFDYVEKPLKLRDLSPVLAHALEVRCLRQENIQLREMVGIHELCAAIGFTLDTNSILDKAIDVALQQTGGDEASILLMTSDGQELEIAAVRGAGREPLLGRCQSLDVGIAGWVARNREPLILNGPVNDPRFAPVAANGHIASAMIVPMLVAGECIGVLNVNASQSHRPFSLGQLKAMTLLAGTVAPALRAAALHSQLRDSEQRLRELTENLPSVLWMTNGDASQMLHVNPAYEKVWNRSCASLKADARSWIDAVHPDDRPAARERYDKLLRGEQITWAFRIIQPDGSIRFIEDRAFPMRDQIGLIRRIVGFSDDVTERVQLEAQFRQAQKMEAFGQLAGGVAHDFNNLLNVIIGFSEMILSDMVPAEQHTEFLHEIRKAGAQAASLTRQLLAFSRRQVLQPVTFDLNNLIRNTEKMLRRLIGEDIDIQAVLAPDLGKLKADPGQFEQVIMNLAVNARDAMPTGGRLTIETRNVELKPESAQKSSDVSAGSYVLLSVTDTGCGMDDATKSRIFEPFFTTKEVGKGTGLGLATVHGIVKQSGGSIEVASEVGRGTTFRILLPRHAGSAAAETVSSEESLVPRGTETILLAEDEEGVRAMMRLALESTGYTVLAAANGEEALHLCRQHPGLIHLLLTDVVMPKMGGRQLADHVVAQRPGTKVLYSSGYTDDAVVRHGVTESEIAFLQKPFTPMALARKVREVLGRKAFS